MIQATVDAMYSTGEQNEFLEVTYANARDRDPLLQGLLLRRGDPQRGGPGQEVGHQGAAHRRRSAACAWSTCCAAVVEEFREHEDMPNTTNPDDWARISGRKGERITFIRTIVADKNGRGKTLPAPGADETGQYL